MSAALGLMRLQRVDSRIDQIDDMLARIRVELENDADVKAARHELDAAETARTEAERSRLETETQATSLRSKMQQAESTLYGGSVRNPKELQDLQADVASLRRHLVALEETELSWMEKLEAAELQRLQASAQMDQVLSRAGADNDRLVAQQTDLNRTRGDLLVERGAAAGAIAPKVLQMYETLRKSRRGVAVAEVTDNACGACGTVLTAALQQSARHAPEPVNCPSCGRILFGD